MKILIVIAFGLLYGCDTGTPTTKSPFSGLDTVKTKSQENTKEEKKDGSSIKSPFSGIDNKN